MFESDYLFLKIKTVIILKVKNQLLLSLLNKRVIINKLLRHCSATMSANEATEYYKVVKGIIDNNKENSDNGRRGMRNYLSQEVVRLDATLTFETDTINHSCEFLNKASGPAIKERSHSTIFVGKDSAALLVSLKNLADSMLGTSCHISDMVELSESVPHIQKNSYLLEDHKKSLTDFRQKIEIIMQGFRKLQLPENETEPLLAVIEHTQQTVNLSSASEISSFSDKDIITSSPISRNKQAIF
ncbi:uncharacterized protein LOC126733654 [Anthonomus grandis grandis]|uniref:uncharacterized protein LOC126733654 n=1 Tax=Anthonomus grandis grandis TaxID=2921223 RepID=UPI0021659567|nr:uncharacterized protein LOC126733654 [Anthonomus grandis grandis]